MSLFSCVEADDGCYMAEIYTCWHFLQCILRWQITWWLYLTVKHNEDNQMFVYCMRILTRQLSCSYYRWLSELHNSSSRLSSWRTCPACVDYSRHVLLPKRQSEYPSNSYEQVVTNFSTLLYETSLKPCEFAVLYLCLPCNMHGCIQAGMQGQRTFSHSDLVHSCMMLEVLVKEFNCVGFFLI